MPQKAVSTVGTVGTVSALPACIDEAGQACKIEN